MDVSYGNQNNMVLYNAMTISYIKYAFIMYGKILHYHHVLFTTFSQSYENLMSPFHNISRRWAHEIRIFQ